ncbi:MAG: polymerase sigma-70 factor [Gemmatimonadetes bacterium]|nr:polymerase sigma-70 factor [Gemmatimonadota bacterium]
MPNLGPNLSDDDAAAGHTGPEADFALYSEIRGGSTTAFERLFREYHPGLCSFAVRMIGRDDVAEDLVQEVFLFIWRHRESWDVRTSVRQYLYSALRHGALRYLRHERVVRRHIPETIALFDRAPKPADAQLVRAETIALVRAAIARLPERCRLVYTLHRENGLTYAEVAEVMEISPKTVDVQMGRALKALRRALGSYYSG